MPCRVCVGLRVRWLRNGQTVVRACRRRCRVASRSCVCLMFAIIVVVIQPSSPAAVVCSACNTGGVHRQSVTCSTSWALWWGWKGLGEPYTYNNSTLNYNSVSGFFFAAAADSALLSGASGLKRLIGTWVRVYTSQWNETFGGPKMGTKQIDVKHYTVWIYIQRSIFSVWLAHGINLVQRVDERSGLVSISHTLCSMYCY